MEITIDQLLNGNATIIKGKTYLSAKEYVEPFLNNMANITTDFRVKVKLADQLSITDTSNIIYNRVLVEAVLPPEHTIDNHEEIIGFIYGLDIRRPVAKLYRGYLNQACTNLTVFNPEWMSYQEIQPEKNLEYKVKELLETSGQIKKILDTMKSSFLEHEEIYEQLGRWIDFTLSNFHHNGIHSTKLSPSLVLDSYKLVYKNKESPYFTEEGASTSIFNVYNAMTQTLRDDSKDIMNKFEKTLLINQMLNVS